MTNAGMFAFALIAATMSPSSRSFGAQSDPNDGPLRAVNSAAVGEARSLFNQTSAHCHGSDASTSLSERNLRRLKLRNGAEMHELFDQTVRSGRLDKGMPAWNEVLDAQAIDKIY